MKDLHEIWGQAIIHATTLAGCTAQVLRRGVPETDWSGKGELIACHNNGFEPEISQQWWVAFDAGTYFLEELIG